jgi:hypothetical protein
VPDRWLPARLVANEVNRLQEQQGLRHHFLVTDRAALESMLSPARRRQS